MLPTVFHGFYYAAYGSDMQCAVALGQINLTQNVWTSLPSTFIYIEFMVEQALVLVGGKAKRLQKEGVPVPLAKSFLCVGGQPLLFWNLCSLYAAGVRALVIAGEELRHLRQAERVVASLPYRFAEVRYFQDWGYGTHGVPFYASYALDSPYLFECGHGLSSPAHYQALAAAKTPETVVFSAFATHPTNPRLPVRLHNGNVTVAQDEKAANHALAHPIIADRRYSRSLVTHKFNIISVLTHYAAKGQIKYVMSDLPPEFDTSGEMQLAKSAYEQYLTTTGLL